MKAQRHNHLLAALLMATALTGVGCDDFPTGETSHREQTATEALVEGHSNTRQPPSVPPFVIDSERSTKMRELGPVLRVSQIDWTAAATHVGLDRAALDNAQRQLLTEAPLPALLPSDPNLLAHAILTTGERWYAASASWDRHNVFVQGRSASFLVPGLESDPESASDFSVTRNELIVDLSFVAYGAAYTITVECDSPLDDPRCTEDDYVIGLAESLARVQEVE